MEKICHTGEINGGRGHLYTSATRYKAVPKNSQRENQ